MFGYTAEEAIGRSSRHHSRGPVERGGRSPRPDPSRPTRRPFRNDRRRKDGTLIPISLTVSPIRDTRGRYRRVEDGARSVGASRLRDDARSRPCGSGPASLETANSQLESFAYSVSHDLRAPLRGMQGLADACSRTMARLDERARDYARRIVAEARTARSAHPGSAGLQPIDADRSGARARRRRRGSGSRAAPSGRRHQRQPRDDRGRSWAAAAEGQSRRADSGLTNLISNAVKFGGSEPTVRVRAQNVDGIGADLGRGSRHRHRAQASRADLPRVRAAARSRGIPGTGIGLAIVHKAIERLGGRVGVESQEGKGSRFWFELPRAEAA